MELNIGSIYYSCSVSYFVYKCFFFYYVDLLLSILGPVSLLKIYNINEMKRTSIIITEDTEAERKARKVCVT